ncbi:MAG: phosphoribosyltransferase [Actinobacteria bacterium]|nr:phosphoribosyltransferase [Actinomycetota bacterium]
MTPPWRDRDRSESAGYADRRQAGTVLAERLVGLKGRRDVLVLALPRGGVEVAYEVARALDAPLDVLVVRKIGAPGREELALGALATGDVLVLDERLARQFGVGGQELTALKERARVELERRERLYRGDRPPLDVAGKVVVLVDDGLATGSTMRAAVAALRTRRPLRVVVAAPVGPPPVCQIIREEADEVVCLLEPPAMYAVGSWYGDFSQTSDDEVRRLLDAARAEYEAAAPVAGRDAVSGADDGDGSAADERRSGGRPEAVSGAGAPDDRGDEDGR